MPLGQGSVGYPLMVCMCVCIIMWLSSNRRNYWTQSGGGGAGTSNRWTGQGYFPNYPASCPYVTAVGATMVT